MSLRITLFCALAGLSALQASDLNDPGLLARAASANQNLYAALQSFVCNEQIERYSGRKHIDTVTAKVSLENGIEHYSEILEKERPLHDLSSLGGAWSEGEFGTLLIQTQQLLATQQVRCEVQGICDFDVSEAESPWKLTVSGGNYVIPFHTRVWLAADSGKILKIARTSTLVPPELRIAQINWSVSLSPVDLNGTSWWLPVSGDYQVMYRESGRREWNTMKFSGYRRYGSEVLIRFN